ncbi:pentatricopeptide repeat-containing protein At1g62680, mitochondrial-like [Pyrus communis]|uniref:pentatricopeptide repeat-containing protein At1g62680, mitochondrial-like n=1 Tax=Pyrus communis TaxID=23211 RepID=UPI0035C048D7
MASSSSLKVGYGIGSRLRLRGMEPVHCLLYKSTLFINDFAPFHSQSFEPNKSRNTQLQHLVKASNLEDALHVFDEMLQMRPLPSVVLFNQIMGQVAKLKHYSAGRREFVLIFEPSVVTFHALLLQKREAEAIQLLRKMEGGGCKPGIVSYNMIIDSLCKDTMFVDVLDLFSEMIVDTHCKKGMVGEAKSVVEMMIHKDIKPDIVTYNSLMNGYCLKGEMDEAKNVFDLMLSKGFIMGNAYSYNILINGYCKQKRIDEAWMLFLEMSGNTNFRGFINKNEMSRAIRLVRQMVEEGFSADASTYELVLELRSKYKVHPALLPLIERTLCSQFAYLKVGTERAHEL